MAGERERAERPSVKAFLQRDEAALPWVRQPREFQRRLVGLAAAVAEERAQQAGLAHELLAEEPLRGVVVKVGDVQQCVRLVAQRLDEARVAVAEDVHGDAAEEVPVRAAVRVDDARALAAARMERRAVVRAEDEGLFPRLDGVGRFVMQQQGAFLLVRSQSCARPCPARAARPSASGACRR